MCISNRNEQSIFNSSKKTLEVNISNGPFNFACLDKVFRMYAPYSYKMPIMKWQVRIEDEINIFKLRKVEVRAELRKRMGHVIDKPRVGGAGTSNNGNTARRFFRQYDVSANVMNMDADLVKRLHIILATMSCGYDINYSKFKTFCWETAIALCRSVPLVSYDPDTS